MRRSPASAASDDDPARQRPNSLLLDLLDRDGRALDRAEAEKRHADVLHDLDGPYWNKNHPRHRLLVEDMALLTAALEGGPEHVGQAGVRDDDEREIDAVTTDLDGPYWNKQHPGHAAAVDAVLKLRETLERRRQSASKAAQPDPAQLDRLGTGTTDRGSDADRAAPASAPRTGGATPPALGQAQADSRTAAASQQPPPYPTRQHRETTVGPEMLPTEFTPEESRARLHDLVAEWRRAGYSFAADSLQHALEGSGKPRFYSRDELRTLPNIAELEDRVRGHFERSWTKPVINDRPNPLPGKLLALRDGETARLPADHWEAAAPSTMPWHLFSKDPDERRAFGASAMRSYGTGLVARREGDSIRIEGEVLHTWKDRFDFDEVRFGTAEAARVQEAGGLTPFWSVARPWRQKVSLTLRIRPGRSGAALDVDRDRSQWEDVDVSRDD